MVPEKFQGIQGNSKVLFQLNCSTIASGLRARQNAMDERLSFERVVEEHYASVYRFALSLARNEDQAGDLTQQTFYTWGRKGHQLVDPAKVRSWLFTTLHREFLKLRRNSIRVVENVEDDSDDSQDPAPFPFSRLDRETILRALSRLDEVYRASVVLFYLEDYTYPEIAGMLDVPVGTVKSRAARGIAQLQKMLLETKRFPAGKENP
jgi:RNA polymerase sigma-70 factor, ECF subfamily